LSAGSHVDYEAEGGEESSHRCIDLIVFSEEPTHQTKDYFVGSVQRHEEEAETSGVDDFFEVGPIDTFNKGWGDLHDK